MADTLRGRIDGAVAPPARRDALSTRPMLREIDKVVVIACGTASHAGMVAKYAIEHWTRLPVEVELASEFRYRDPIVGPGQPRHRDLAVRRDHGHAHGAAPRARSRARGRWRSATPSARRSRASPTPCSTRTPAPRSRSPRPRRSSPRSSPRTSSALYLAQVRGTKFEDEIRAIASRAATACPSKVDLVLDTTEPVRALARAACPTRASVLFLGRHVGLPGGARGCAQAQGAGLHARRGLRRRRAQARSHRPDRGRRAGHRHRAVAAWARGAARQDRVEHPGGAGPRRLRRSRSPRRATSDIVAYADDVDPHPAVPDAACSRSSRPFRCRCSPARWRRRKGHDVDQPRNLAKSVTVE